VVSRRQATRSALTALLAAVTIGGCAGSPAAAPATSPPTERAFAPTSSEALPTPRSGPVCPDVDDTAFRHVLGGREVTGIVRGSGRHVVVLSHQSRGTVCDLAGLGHALADAGFRVVAWDADIWTNQETLGRLVADERRRGARTIALVGASAGGATSIGAAAAIAPPVDVVVALSPSGQSETFGDVVPAAGRFRGPLMVLTGELDSAFAGIVPELAAAHRGRESIRLLPGTSEHGRSLVLTADDPHTAEIVRFLTP
jgi:hypothetical protein